jgi:hypothetical protein
MGGSLCPLTSKKEDAGAAISGLAFRMKRHKIGIPGESFPEEETKE